MASSEEEVGAEALVRLVADAGITVCFANPGTTEMHVVDALGASAIRSVLGLHENVVTGAADGFARMARRPAMTLLHLGPGLANGLANLHNARRAGSPVFSVVGDMAVWHSAAEAPLKMDVQALAHTVSCWVGTPRTPLWLRPLVREGLAHCAAPAAAGCSRVCTLVLPHDVQWEPVPDAEPPAGTHAPVADAPSFAEQLQQSDEAIARAAAQEGAAAGAEPPVGVREYVARAAAALHEAGARGALYLGGDALLEPTLSTLAGVARAVGATLCCVNSFARVDRGRGRPPVERVPYFPQQAAAYFDAFSVVLLVGAPPPVAQFGYADGPSSLIDAAATASFALDFLDLAAAVRHLASLLPPAPPPPPPVSKAPALPTGRLNANKLCAVVAALQPADAIIVDESLTSGTAYWALSEEAPPFAHLALTGGAIGQGPPAAVGAAVACPERRVINLQADGSGLYTAQALWTQAREGLKVTTVVCANNAYNILRIELSRQKPKHGGRGDAVDGLTQLQRPQIDWVHLARGYGVAAAAVDTAEDLARELADALDADGPRVIVANI